MLDASYIEIMDGAAQFVFKDADGVQILTLKPERSVDVRFIGPMLAHAETDYFYV